jgi:hypothetical protein
MIRTVSARSAYETTNTCPYAADPGRSNRLFGLIEVDEPREVLKQFGW